MPKRQRNLARVLITILTAVVLWAVVILGLQRRVLYPRHLVGPQGNAPPGIEQIAFDTSTGRGEAWYLPPLTPGRGGAAVLLFAHGNGELIDDWPDALMPYRRMGMGVFLVEYRGYGQVAGSPSEAGITEDFTAAIDALAGRDDVDADRFVYHGRSLGGGVVCALARHRPPRALVLESTFTSIAALARRMGVPRFLVLDPYDNLAFLTKSALPCLLIHGKQDSIIPISHAHALHAATAQSRLKILDGAGHNDGLFLRPDYWEVITRFLGLQGMVEE